ncbi:MAG: CRISPR-associated helicase Cas3' [Coprococcus sp.]|nr:CRISPR-associated helicase Cas3' [Coprococcus sp.]
MLLEEELTTKWGKTGEFSETIREHTDCLKKEAKRLFDYGYIDHEMFVLLTYVCEKHDYGKINDAMQQRMKKHIRFNPDIEVQHNLLSALFVHPEDFENEYDYICSLYAVLFHHDTHSNAMATTEISEKNILIKDFADRYRELGAVKPSRKYLKKIEQILNIRDCDEPNKDEIELYNKMSLLKGFLHKCDYSASAHIQCEYVNDFLNSSMQKLKESWDGLDWNDLQYFMIENQNRNIIATAPTGYGKTEAGLLWSGNNKCFFVLPLRTAINAMYERIGNKILNNRYLNERLALLHADTQSYYIKNTNEDIDDMLDYYVKSKQLSLPITITTLDQIFNFTLKYYGYEYKLSTLSYARVIIDEIQTYSPDLLAYLVYGIEKIVEAGGKVAVLTATLPPFARQKLIDVMGSDLAEADFSNRGIVRHNVKVFEKTLNSADVVNKWHELNKMESRKLLIICNSIATAQQIFEEICNMLSEEMVEINLLHSNFIKMDRSAKEKQILKTGQTYTDSNGKKINCLHEIWVTTSVVEASLDIDFDYLFTELLDLFSLFQRMGRVNRKGVKCYELANCFVYTELQGNPLKCYKKSKSEIGNGFEFVDDDIYDLSKEAILEVDDILDESKKMELINSYLSYEKIQATGYAKKYQKQYNYLKNLYILEKESNCPIREIDNINIIPLSVYEQHIKEIEEIENQLNSNKTLGVDKIVYVEKLYEFVLSVNANLMHENRTSKPKILKSIQISKHINIPIVDCEYDYEFGLIKISREEKSKNRFI